MLAVGRDCSMSNSPRPRQGLAPPIVRGLTPTIASGLAPTCVSQARTNGVREIAPTNVSGIAPRLSAYFLVGSFPGSTYVVDDGPVPVI